MPALMIGTTLATLRSSRKIFIEVQQLKISVNEDDITYAEFSYAMKYIINYLVFYLIEDTPVF